MRKINEKSDFKKRHGRAAHNQKTNFSCPFIVIDYIAFKPFNNLQYATEINKGRLACVELRH